MRISTGMWNDERIVGMSPDEKILWSFLLTGPHADALPGLATIGIARMAEGAGVSQRSARSALTKMQSVGLLDYNAELCVLHIPSGPRHNRPDNTRVLASWFRKWWQFPTCAQKRAYVESLRHVATGDSAIAEEWRRTFAMADPDAPPQARRPSRPAVPRSAPHITRRTLIAVAARDEGKCRYCGVAADSIDHVVPRQQGGGDEPDNLVTCCLPCNKFKGNRTPMEAGMVLSALRGT